MIKLLRIVPIAAFLLAGTAYAAEYVPSAKPDFAISSPLKDGIEFYNFRNAMRAASNDEWGAVRGYKAGISTPAGRDLLLWRLAVEDRNAGFFELKEAVETLKGWPRHNKIRIEAEKKIDDSGMNPEFIIKYFDQWPPLTGTGKLAFAHALKTKGFIEETKAQIRSAWHNNTLSKDNERKLLNTYGDYLTSKDHIIRADKMIWGRHRSEAYRMLNRLHGADKALATARYKLMRNAKGIDAAVRRVPKAYESDGGLLYERTRWRRRHGLVEEATEFALNLPEGSLNKVAAKRMWSERHLLARRALKDGDFATAYTLAAGHGMTKGAEFAAGEFLAGWLALQKLQDPILALSHFTRLKNGVSTPVSLARAYYWIGRAEQAMGAVEDAQTAWQKASKHDFTYYGQLAAQKLGGKTLDLGKDPQPTAMQRTDFKNNLQIQALKLIGLSGNRTLYRTFSYHLDDILPNAVDHVMLAALAQEMGQKRAAMRAAKAALWRGEVLPDSAWPIISLPDGLPVDRAFLLALMRQETELDPKAVSRVGAQGLMQLMPATARHTARAIGTRYRKSWLTSDPAYNVRLGAAHLQELLDEFNGSYILATVSYNAGKTRAYRWIREYGDPRTDADPIDWVESIPFSETRNYVQRVLENVQVYRHRLAGAPVPISIWDDLNRGAGTVEARVSTTTIAKADVNIGAKIATKTSVGTGEPDKTTTKPVQIPHSNCVIVALPDRTGTSAFCPRPVRTIPQG
ncbi:MAG: transglycosylase [Robiginitomaculum sp.]|nr:MAG: transglycosylase [Robiginitomaculum sp.]